MNTPLEDSILKQLSLLQIPHPHATTENQRVLETLQRWRTQLKLASSKQQLLWCFAPDLTILLAHALPLTPKTPFLRQRLQDIPVWRLSSELLQLGGPLRSDTMLLQLDGVWQIFLRDQEYRQQLQREADEPSHPTPFSSDDEHISWRQELNLAHEWGHRATDLSLLYQDRLLEKLSPHHPSVGYPLYAWFQAILEGLAEALPYEGALFFLIELARRPQTEPFARALFLERLEEFRRFRHQHPEHPIYEWLLEVCLRASETSGTSPLDEDSHPTALSEKPLTPVLRNSDWEQRSKALCLFGVLLERALLEGIERIPGAAEVDGWLEGEQARITALFSQLKPLLSFD